MKTLGWEQAAEWACGVGLPATVVRAANEYPAQNGHAETVSTINTSISFPNEDPALRLTLPLPQKPYQVAYLANALLPHSESQELSPWLLWMTDFGFWSEVSERVAHSLVGCFRSSRGETAPLIESRAHLFGSTEATDAQALHTIAIVFGWDCYVIRENTTYYAFTNHDEYWEVVSRSSEAHALFKEKRMGGRPTNASQYQLAKDPDIAYQPRKGEGKTQACAIALSLATPGRCWAARMLAMCAKL